MYRHILVTGTYTSLEAIPSKTMTEGIKDVIVSNEGDPIALMSYTTGYPMSPVECGLKDAWLALTNEQRHNVSESYPELHRAIFLLMMGHHGGINGFRGNHTEPHTTRPDEQPSGVDGTSTGESYPR